MTKLNHLGHAISILSCHTCQQDCLFPSLISASFNCEGSGHCHRGSRHGVQLVKSLYTFLIPAVGRITDPFCWTPWMDSDGLKKRLTAAQLQLHSPPLIVVAIILIIAAIAIPNMLRARIAANESSAVASIRTINTAQISYNSAY